MHAAITRIRILYRSTFDGRKTLEIPRGSHASWNCVCKISRTWKVLENEIGPGKSWKSKCKVLESAGICSAMMRTQMPKICASAHLYSVFEQFLCYFFATRDSDEHIPYSSIDAAIILQYIM